MKKCFFGFVFLFVLAIPFAYSQDASSFISDYNDEQNLYDYHGVLSNPSEVERLLQNFEE